MKLTIEVYLNDVVGLLSLTAVNDPEILGVNLDKAEIKDLCLTTVKRSGVEYDGWDDGMSDEEAATINGWAYAQARRYTW